MGRKGRYHPPATFQRKIVSLSDSTSGNLIGQLSFQPQSALIGHTEFRTFLPQNLENQN